MCISESISAQMTNIMAIKSGRSHGETHQQSSGNGCWWFVLTTWPCDISPRYMTKMGHCSTLSMVESPVSQAGWGTSDARGTAGSRTWRWFSTGKVIFATLNENVLSACSHQECFCFWLQKQSFGGCARMGQRSRGEAPGSEGSPVSFVWPPRHTELSALLQTLSSEASQHKQFSTLNECGRGGGQVAPRGILRVSHEACTHLQLFCRVHLLELVPLVLLARESQNVKKNVKKL